MTPYDMATQAAEQLSGTCKGIADLGEEYEDPYAHRYGDY